MNPADLHDVANFTGEPLARYLLQGVNHHLWDAREQLEHYCEILWSLPASLL